MSPTRPSAPVRMEERAVAADDPGRFLPPVLQRVEAERRMGRGVGMPEDAEDPALFAQLVVVGRDSRPLRCRHYSTPSLSPSSWFRSPAL